MTSIKEIENNTISLPLYDVYGREVTKIKKNTLYIKNNEKFIKF